MSFGSSIYNWDRWLNGQIWMVKQQVDFTCYGTSLIGAAHSAAKKRGLRVTGSVFTFDYRPDIVIFCSFHPDDLTMPNLKAVPQWRNLMDELGRSWR